MTPISLTHIGGPTLLIETGGWRILVDPTFDPPGRTYHFGWGSSSRKVTGPAIAAADLGPLDVVLLTHDHHADNLDDAGRELLPSAGIVVTTTAGAGRLGGETRGLDPWAKTTLDGPGRPLIEVTATPCRHGPPFSHFVAGDVIGFALRWDGLARGALWISGDTVLYDGVREVAERLDVEIAILHLGSAQFTVTGPVRYTMDARAGIDLCMAVQPRIAIPVHYEGWSHFRQGREAIETAFSRAPEGVRDSLQMLPIGAAVEIPA